MTVIVAVTDGTRVCVAADSQAQNGGTIATLRRPKIAKAGGYVFGASGELMVNDWATRVLPGVFPPDDGTPIEEQARRMYELCWDWLDRRRALHIENGASQVPGTLLIARRSEFAFVEASGAVLTVDHDYWAIGSGRDTALGVMWFGMQAEHVDHEHVARMAVNAALLHDTACGFPIRVEWTEP